MLVKHLAWLVGKRSNKMKYQMKLSENQTKPQKCCMKNVCIDVYLQMNINIAPKVKGAK